MKRGARGEDQGMHGPRGGVGARESSSTVDRAVTQSRPPRALFPLASVHP